MRRRSHQVGEQAANERAVAESEALAEQRDVQYRTAVGIDPDPALAAVLNRRGICAIKELRELRALVCYGQLLDPVRMIEGVRADDVDARHDRISPDGAME